MTYEERVNRAKAQLNHFVHIDVIDRWRVGGWVDVLPSWSLRIQPHGPDVEWTLDQVEAFVSGVHTGMLAADRKRGWNEDTEADRALEERSRP